MTWVFDTLDNSEKTIATLQWEIDGGHRRRNRKGIKLTKGVHGIYGNNEMRAQMLVISIGSRKGAPSRKGRVVDGQMTKLTNEYAPPPPPPGKDLKSQKHRVGHDVFSSASASDDDYFAFCFFITRGGFMRPGGM